MARSRLLLLLMSAGLTVGACHRSQGESEVRPERPRARSKDPYLIEAEELKDVEAQNLYEAVRVRRPAWLTKTVKGSEGRIVTGDEAVVVYLDDRKLGMLPVLRSLRIDLALQLKYLSPTEAQLRFGPNHGPLAAIIVEIAK